MHHTNIALEKATSRKGGLKSWDVVEVFENVCKASNLQGYGMKKFGDDNLLAGAGIDEPDEGTKEELQPGGAMIQMGGEHWATRMSGACNEIIFDKIGEDDLFAKYKKAKSLGREVCEKYKYCDSVENEQKKKEKAKAKSDAEKAQAKAEQELDAKIQTEQDEKRKQKAKEEKKKAKAAKKAAPKEATKEGASKVGSSIKFDWSNYLEDLIERKVVDESARASKTSAQWDAVLRSAAQEKEPTHMRVSSAIKFDWDNYLEDLIERHAVDESARSTKTSAQWDALAKSAVKQMLPSFDLSDEL